MSAPLLTAADHQIIDRLCDAFEADLRLGRPQELAARVAQVEKRLQPQLEQELRKIEAAYFDKESPPDATLAAVTLKILAGPHAGEGMSFKSHQTVVVGREHDATWRMSKDPYFSRYQFRVETNPPRSRLVDLESRNGTSVNGNKVKEAELRDGDRIECGETVFKVSIATSIGHKDVETLDLPPAVVQPSSTIDYQAKPVAPGRIAEFDIRHELGRGAMGVVYYAVHRSTRQPAAIKLIQPEAAASPEGIRLFLREAQILSQLQHPRIVECLSVGFHENKLFIAMEYVPAIGVLQLLKSQARPRQIRLSVGLACFMLEALQHAHEQDIVHRDVKPSNILVYKVNKKVSLKLADFGLAKNYLNAGFSSLSCENEVRGTITYMAPEQLINCRYAKPACDIYACGACLYHFLSGKLPVDIVPGTNHVARVLNTAPVPLAERCRDLPLELASVVDRALAREPGDRFSSAEHMRKCLLKFLDVK
jgi:serine/threonine-protein kinase